jgi:phage tail sheath gpL-like
MVAGRSSQSLENIGNYYSAMGGGPYAGSVVVTSGAVQASGTLTVSSTGPTNGETATVANVTLTAETSGADPTMGQFNISATPATVAANIALAINSTAALSGIVTATSALGVVTITAVAPGAIGNGIELDAGTLANTVAVAFSGGVDGSVITVSNGL